MIDFEPTAADRLILDEARRQADIALRHARFADDDDNLFLPPEFPEAAGQPDTRAMLAEHTADISGPKILECLLFLEEWAGGVSLREALYPLGNHLLAAAGSPEQQRHWAKHAISIAMTEPVGGSDPSAARTTARLDPATGEWVLNGEKIFITYATTAHATIVLARAIEPGRPPYLSTFLVEQGTPGFTVGPQVRKMGIRFEDTAGLVFTDCRIPAFNHIAGDLKAVLTAFNESRPIVAAFAMGVARAALDFTRSKLLEIGIVPDYNAGPAAQCAAADRLIQLESEWEATWLIMTRAKWIEETEGLGKIEASMAKAMGGKLGRRVTQGCIELLGAAAISESCLPEKWFRDARIFDIYEGTGEIQRLIIARHLLGYSPKELN